MERPNRESFLSPELQTRFINFLPPTNGSDGGTSWLDRGWHEPDWISLDWDGNVGLTVYSRAHGYYSDPDISVQAQGELFVGQDYYNCRNVVWLDVYDVYNQWMGSVGFVDTASPQFQGRIDYWFGQGGVYNSAVAASVMTWGDTCSWSGGYHVHESHWNSGSAPLKEINQSRYAGYGLSPWQNNIRDNWARRFGW